MGPVRTPTPSPSKETFPERAQTVELTGTTIAVGVPEAFTGTRSAQIPGYINIYEAFKAKGMTGIYVVAVNDQFVMKLCVKRRTAPTGTPIYVLADDQGEFAGATGLIGRSSFKGMSSPSFHPILTSPISLCDDCEKPRGRVSCSRRGSMPSKVTITDAKTILAQL
ncbi:hypothetical protein EDD85DRAFT_955668 [Armillaria nabsnona]|nr:hypothetical protein EDD85DRAFT_955668 [Armillaria nabsnona]